MSFLQINNPDGTSGIKRPFRLSDIQDIWNGITSLFKPIKGENFRIISGFNLEGDTYSAGAVYYDGNIYEYDRSKPITSSTTLTYFAKIVADTRLFESGDEYPFAYKYVCGGSSFASESGFVSQRSFDNFRTNISKFKSYLGTGSVTTEELADESVTTEKLAPNLRPIVSERDRIEVSTDTSYDIGDLIANGKVKTIIATNTSGPVTVQINAMVSMASYNTFPSLIYVPVAASASAELIVQLKASGLTIKTYELAGNTIGVIVLALSNVGVSGATYVPTL